MWRMDSLFDPSATGSFRKQARNLGTKRGREEEKGSTREAGGRREEDRELVLQGGPGSSANGAWKAAPRGRWRASKQSDGCHFQLHSLGPKGAAGISLRR